MKVRAVKSFSANLDGEILHFPDGKEFELPKGVDWLEAGLVVPVRTTKKRKATVKPKEKAVTNKK